MKNVFLILIAAIMLSCGNTQKEEKQTKIAYQPEWESLKQYDVPEWWLDAKFGIYFHWGPYSVPAHKTEWYSKWMYDPNHPINEHHRNTYGELNEFGYKDFIPMFTGEKFDADEWAELFKKSGAKFAGPVAEHADGFAMWNSDLTEWNSMKMGPKRDIVGEMEKAIRKQDMKFIATYHRHWLYAWYPTWDENTDASDPKYEGLYGPKVPEGTFVMADKPTSPLPDDKFNQEWLDRLNELMDKYEPDIIWFDNKMDIIGEDYRKQFLANYYNKAQEWGQEVVCTYKFEDMAKGAAVLDIERTRMSDIKDYPWLTDDSVDWEAWSHISNPRYKSTNRLIDFLVDVVSKNGAVLLNIPPTANGEIPEEVRSRLLEMGAWLEMNGEAIYGTRPWKIFGEGPQEIVEGHLREDENPDAVAEDIRFTTKGDFLYAIALDWPKDKMVVKSFASSKNLLDKTIESVEMLGSSENIGWDLTNQGLEVTLPSEKPCEHAFVFKIKLSK